MRKSFFALLLTVIMLVTLMSPAKAKQYNLDTIISETASYITTKVKEPKIGSIGGEWAILGLARSEVQVDKNYYDCYYKYLEQYLKESNGVLHKRKYTEYSRVILAVTAIGKNPCNVGGYNLLTALGDFEKTVWQGINGPVWALIALDSGSYSIPENKDAKVQATREMYLDYILERQNLDGGWSLLENSPSEIDITAMALQALSNYRHIEKVNITVEKALEFLKNSQNENGGFSSLGSETCESSAQVLTALCMLGIDYNSQEFTKNGKSVLDDILSYYKGKGFSHIKNGEDNLMATEQAFYSLVALERFENGKQNLYTMIKKEDFVKNAYVDILKQNMLKIIDLLKRVEKIWSF